MGGEAESCNALFDGDVRHIRFLLLT